MNGYSGYAAKHKKRRSENYKYSFQHRAVKNAKRSFKGFFICVFAFLA